MKYSQLIENTKYIDDLMDDIVNLLTISSTKGYNKIKTRALITDLKNIGYDIDERTIHLALDEISSVVSVNKDFIEISTDSADEEEMTDMEELDVDTNSAFDDISGEEETDEVDRAAMRQASRNIKDEI